MILSKRNSGSSIPLKPVKKCVKGYLAGVVKVEKAITSFKLSQKFLQKTPKVARLFEAGRLLTFPTYRVGAYSRWALIRGWALNRINTVFVN